MTAGRRHDILTADTQVRERVRKLEVTAQSLAYKPREWHNQEHLIHLIAELVFLQSHWLQGSHFTPAESPYPENSVGRQAQQLYDLMMTGGYGSVPAAQQWTGMLLACDAIMHPPAGLNWAGDGITVADHVLQSPTAQLTPWWDRNLYRLCKWTGMGAEGVWAYADAGTFMGIGMPPMPAGDGLVIDGRTVYRSGNWYRVHGGSHSAIYFAGTDTSLYYDNPSTSTGPHACFSDGPPQPPLNGFNPGGQPIYGCYDPGCPASPRSEIEGGCVLGAYVIIPDPDLYLTDPPSPWMGEAVTHKTTVTDFASMTWPTLIDRVEAALPYFPGVADWVNQRKDIQPQRKQWHRLHRHPRAQGWVEAQVRDREVVLRGALRLTTTRTRLETLLVFDDRQLPPPAHAGDRYWLRVRVTHNDADHGAANLIVNRWPPAANFPNVWRMTLNNPPSVEGFTTDEDIGYDMTLHFDGARWPTDTSLY